MKTTASFLPLGHAARNRSTNHASTMTTTAPMSGKFIVFDLVRYFSIFKFQKTAASLISEPHW
ncbi:MAG: hypothetical protein NTY01_03140 [Verrucomicrobia bacterium]|nr:hypothetical protein [Verrucomicrobiota bacterium]